MTDLDARTETATIDPPTTRSPSVPKHTRLWRAISMLAVVGTVAIGTVAVLQARSASDVPVPDREPLPLESTTVSIADLVVPSDARLAVLGLPRAESRASVEPAGTVLEIPEGKAAVVALSSGNGALTGLAVVPRTADRTAIELSARTTAEALLLLSPGILGPDLDDAIANLEAIESDPAFERLVEALRTDSTISTSNGAAEAAYAEIADRFSARAPAPDQGCDSVLATNAYAATGTCVQPRDNGVLITNEQDRWALLYNDTPDYGELCGIVAPTGVPGDEVLIGSEQCGGRALFVAPGPVLNQGERQPVIDDRIRAAAAITSLHSYVGPFADLVGGSAGFADDSVEHIRRNSSEIVAAVDLLLETDEEFATAMDVSRFASTPLDRQIAAVAAARALIEAADTMALIPQRAQGEDAHVAILDFYVAAGERMEASRTNWRWEADAVGTVDFGDPQ